MLVASTPTRCEESTAKRLDSQGRIDRTKSENAVEREKNRVGGLKAGSNPDQIENSPSLQVCTQAPEI
jgi:hypothetical protein